jgi:hypothetical protein
MGHHGIWWIIFGGGDDHGAPSEGSYARQRQRRASRSQTVSTNNVTGKTNVQRTTRRKSGDLRGRWNR